MIDRVYLEEGVNGTLFCNDKLICSTIELPWKNNMKGISCIPEGEYEIVERYSKKHQRHLILKGVTERSFVLIHPANDASKELRGCIAPVSKLTGPGRGIQSRLALKKLFSHIQKLDSNEKIVLTIKCKQDEIS